MRMEGNLETWALLERVCYPLVFPIQSTHALSRLRHCGEPSASCVWRIPISRAKTCYAKSRLFPRFPCRRPEHPHPLWILPEHPIRTHRHHLIRKTMRNVRLPSPLRRLRVRQGDFIGMSFSTRLPLGWWTCLRSTLSGRNQRPGECGCRKARLQHTRSGKENRKGRG